MSYRTKTRRKPKRPQKSPTSSLTAHAYRAKYLAGGNSSLSRLLRYCRMSRGDNK
jgi:hypothetical protein